MLFLMLKNFWVYMFISSLFYWLKILFVVHVVIDILKFNLPQVVIITLKSFSFHNTIIISQEFYSKFPPFLSLLSLVYSRRYIFSSKFITSFPLPSLTLLCSNILQYISLFYLLNESTALPPLSHHHSQFSNAHYGFIVLFHLPYPYSKFVLSLHLSYESAVWPSLSYQSSYIVYIQYSIHCCFQLFLSWPTLFPS